jgi:hypothetical protein
MIDIHALRKAHDEFLGVAASGRFGPPPPGEWDAERLLAHVAAADAAIASIALAVIGGQRASYDNRPSLDEWNLRRIVAEAGGLDGLIVLVRTQGQLFCEIAGALPESAASVRVPVLIISGEDLIVDEPWALADLVGGVGAIHLPRHAAQLAELRR